MKRFLRLYTALTLGAFVSLGASAAWAQDGKGVKLPELPEPIQNLAAEGAQIRYLGEEHGLNAWLTVKNGQEQYFYVMPGGKAFVMGLLFDNKGKLVTVDQVRRLQDQGDDLLNQLADDFTTREELSETAQEKDTAFKSPSEQLFHDLEGSNWLPIGLPNAAPIYAFIDPQCPHCHAFVKDLQKSGALAEGKAQLRLIPVGFREETRAQAAFLLAAPNAQERFNEYLAGDEKALPIKSELNQHGVQRNLEIMRSWELSATPMIFYRGRDGGVKVVRGRPKDLSSLIADLPTGN